MLAQLAAASGAAGRAQTSPRPLPLLRSQVAEGRDARGLRDALAKQHGIMVRHYSTKELNNFIRISVGLPEQTDAVVQALRTLA